MPAMFFHEIALYFFLSSEGALFVLSPIILGLLTSAHFNVLSLKNMLNNQPGS